MAGDPGSLGQERGCGRAQGREVRELWGERRLDPDGAHSGDLPEPRRAKEDAAGLEPD
jgi:hypothetical protein